MTTPLLMLALMVGPFVAMHGLAGLARRGDEGRREAAIGLGLLFLFTGVGHFAQTSSMALMLPPWFPEREALVRWSGLMELAIAFGFFVPRWRRTAGLIAASTLIWFFPLNVYSAYSRVPVGGHEWGPAYLLVRAPLQAAIFWWIWRFSLLRPGLAHGSDAARERPSAPVARYR